MTFVRCPNCGRRADYCSESSTGKWWQPVRTVRCSGCCSDIPFPLPVDAGEATIKEQLRDDKACFAASRKESWYDLSEYWIQIYFREHAARWGVTILEPLCPAGPDFRVLLQGEKVDMEVECRWDDYLRHEHHLDWKYSRVKTLVLLCHDDPIPALRPLLPESIIWLPIEDFWHWYQNCRTNFANEFRELKTGVHRAFEEAITPPEVREQERLFRLLPRIKSNENPDAEIARQELVAVLEGWGDYRADWVKGFTLPIRNRLVDLGHLSPGQVAVELVASIDALFPRWQSDVMNHLPLPDRPRRFFPPDMLYRRRKR